MRRRSPDPALLFEEIFPQVFSLTAKIVCYLLGYPVGNKTTSFTVLGEIVLF
jgi:hypothetical protein